MAGGPMKVVILAGGLGTRLSEETQVRPKPMAEIGEHPILWHIMKGYGEQGFTEFVICLGYRGYLIKEYFSNYFLHNSDVTFDLSEQAMTVHQNAVEPWKVTLVDTGARTQTGGRVKRVAPYLDGERFLLTYGDGVADVDLAALLACHEARGKLATVTAVQPPGRFGALEQGPLESLAAAGELGAYRHRGFWQPMDTLRDKRTLEELWESGSAPWK